MAEERRADEKAKEIPDPKEAAGKVSAAEAPKRRGTQGSTERNPEARGRETEDADEK